MQTAITQIERPDVSAEQRAANERIKLIRKLRWIGLDREAQRLQSTLRTVRPDDVVASAPVEAD